VVLTDEKLAYCKSFCQKITYLRHVWQSYNYSIQGRLHKFHQNRAKNLPLWDKKFTNFAILGCFCPAIPVYCLLAIWYAKSHDNPSFVSPLGGNRSGHLSSCNTGVSAGITTVGTETFSPFQVPLAPLSLKSLAPGLNKAYMMSHHVNCWFFPVKQLC